MAYEKQKWINGEIITEAKMNHIEKGLEDAVQNAAVAGLAVALREETDKKVRDVESRLSESITNMQKDLFDIDSESATAKEKYSNGYVSGWWGTEGTAAANKAYWRSKAIFNVFDVGTVVSVEEGYKAIICGSRAYNITSPDYRYEITQDNPVIIDTEGLYIYGVAIGENSGNDISGYSSEQVSEMFEKVKFSKYSQEPKWLNKDEYEAPDVHRSDLDEYLNEYLKKTDQKVGDIESQLSESIADIEETIFDIERDTFDATAFTAQWISGSWGTNGAVANNKYWRHKFPAVAVEKGTEIKIANNHVAVVCLTVKWDSTDIDGGRFELSGGQSVIADKDYYAHVAIGTDGITNISSSTEEQVEELKKALTFTKTNKELKIVDKSELSDYVTHEELEQFEVNIPDLDLDKVQCGCDNQVIVHVPNSTGEVISNATVRLALHKGVKNGSTMWNEIFSNLFKNKMWNVRPCDTNGNVLPYELVSSNNIDFVKDINLSCSSEGLLNFSDGTLVISRNNKIYTSENNGESWVDTGIIGDMGFIDSSDRLFVKVDNIKIVMYRKGEWSNGTVVFSTPTVESTFSVAQVRFCESSNGTIFYGKYSSLWDANVWRMKPNEAVFTKVLDIPTDIGQHIHRMWYDTYDNTVYCGIDCSKAGQKPKNYMSKDNGNTWTEITSIPFRASDYCFFGRINDKLFGSGECSVLGGVGLYSTDNVNNSDSYKVAIDSPVLIRFIKHLPDGSHIAFGSANAQNRINQIYKSNDGETWFTIWTDDASAVNITSVGSGTGRTVTELFKPKGSDSLQIIASGLDGSHALRILIGDNHYSGIMYVNVGDIPVGGKDIVLHTDYVFDGSNAERTFTEPMATFSVVTKEDGLYVNDVKIESTGSVKKVKAYTTGSIKRIEEHNVFAYTMGLNERVNLGRIPINKNKDITVEMKLLSPNTDGWNDAKPKQSVILLGSSNPLIRIGWGAGSFIYTIDGVETRSNGMGASFKHSTFEQIITITLVIGENSLKTYVDGQLIATNASPSYVSSNNKWFDAGDFYFGKSSNYNGNEGAYTNGLVSLKVYDRALTDKEVSNLVNRRNYQLKEGGGSYTEKIMLGSKTVAFNSDKTISWS